MASNLDYLDPALLPLEEKVNTFLETEKSLRRVTQAAAPTTTGATESPEQLRQQLARLEAEIIALLPTRNEWVKVNLGYGPSRVGAWQVPATSTTPSGYELRVVH
jgi:hypothetical protein